MENNLDLFYWDACIFYEYVQGSQSDPLRKKAIDKLLQDNANKKNRLCTSTITHIEVIPAKLKKQEEERYYSGFTTMFLFDIEIDRNIIELAREIKDFYYKPATDTSGYKMLSTGDAIHISTAIIHEAKELHTRDKNPKHGNIKLLGLPEQSPEGKICGQYNLRILDPMVAQVELDV